MSGIILLMNHHVPGWMSRNWENLVGEMSLKVVAGYRNIYQRNSNVSYFLGSNFGWLWLSHLFCGAKSTLLASKVVESYTLLSGTLRLNNLWFDEEQFTRAELEPATSGLARWHSTDWALSNGPNVGCLVAQVGLLRCSSTDLLPGLAVFLFQLPIMFVCQSKPFKSTCSAVATRPHPPFPFLLQISIK